MYMTGILKLWYTHWKIQGVWASDAKAIWISVETPRENRTVSMGKRPGRVSRFLRGSCWCNAICMVSVGKSMNFLAH